MRWALLLAAGLLLFAPGQLEAQQEWEQAYRDAIRGRERVWRSEPVLHEGTGSYYQLVRDQSRQSTAGLSWDAAAEQARKLRHEGRRGRLAVVDSRALQDWLLERWEPGVLGWGGNIWIGLRYWCDYRRMTWSDGTEHPFSAFAVWDRPWYATRSGEEGCSRRGESWLGVFIAGGSSRQWRAASQDIAVAHYIVEYPPPTETPAPDTDGR